jgi:hypothetical protein
MSVKLNQKNLFSHITTKSNEYACANKKWSRAENRELSKQLLIHGKDWGTLHFFLPTRSAEEIKYHFTASIRFNPFTFLEKLTIILLHKECEGDYKKIVRIVRGRDAATFRKFIQNLKSTIFRSKDNTLKKNQDVYDKMIDHVLSNYKEMPLYKLEIEKQKLNDCCQNYENMLSNIKHKQLLKSKIQEYIDYIELLIKQNDGNELHEATEPAKTFSADDFLL